MEKRKIFLANRGQDQLVFVFEPELLAYINDSFSVTENIREADIILVIGGDGRMLHAVQKYKQYGLPFVGLHRSKSASSFGFIMNEPDEKNLEDLGQGRILFIESRLLMARLHEGPHIKIVHAFNDVNFERATTQTLRINVAVNNEMFFQPISCDGILVSTPAGSTAYNANAGGAILPVDANNFILTGISPKRSFLWNSTVLSGSDVVSLEITEPKKRPARFVADGIAQGCEFTRAEVCLSSETVKIGFAMDSDFRKKVMDLQFRGRVGR